MMYWLHVEGHPNYQSCLGDTIPSYQCGNNLWNCIGWLYYRTLGTPRKGDVIVVTQWDTINPPVKVGEYRAKNGWKFVRSRKD